MNSKVKMAFLEKLKELHPTCTGFVIDDVDKEVELTFSDGHNMVVSEFLQDSPTRNIMDLLQKIIDEEQSELFPWEDTLLDEGFRIGKFPLSEVECLNSDCCKEAIHSSELKVCKACKSEIKNQNCMLCERCAEAAKICGHCLKKLS